MDLKILKGLLVVLVIVSIPNVIKAYNNTSDYFNSQLTVQKEPNCLVVSGGGVLSSLLDSCLTFKLTGGPIQVVEHQTEMLVKK